MMLTIILITLTWYATKIYYTKQFTIEISEKDPNMVLATCSKCSQRIQTHVDNIRTPYYCLTCK